MRPALILRAIGHTARNALVASAGTLEPVEGLDGVPYARAGGEIIWIGHGDVVMHPRAAVLQQATRVTTADQIDPGALAPWRPPALPSGERAAATLRSGCARLSRNLPRIAPAKGFARILVGGVPEFPFERAVPLVHAFAHALGAGDTDSVHAAALPLLGLGPGLTPAGDDLVGAALFARRAVAASPVEVDAWAQVAARLIDAANVRSHPIAAALFRDLASGQSFEPLHRLAAVLAAGACDEDVQDAARALIAVGHSSGFEMLAGFIIGVTGALPPQRSETT